MFPATHWHGESTRLQHESKDTHDHPEQTAKTSAGVLVDHATTTYPSRCFAGTILRADRLPAFVWRRIHIQHLYCQLLDLAAEARSQPASSHRNHEGTRVFGIHLTCQAISVLVHAEAQKLTELAGLLVKSRERADVGRMETVRVDVTVAI